MARWKVPPVLTWKDDHPRKQDPSLGLLELIDEAEAQIHWSPWVGPFFNIGKECVYDCWGYRVDTVPTEQCQRNQCARNFPVSTVGDRRVIGDHGAVDNLPTAFALSHEV
jgi:hypothetical protein